MEIIDCDWCNKIIAAKETLIVHYLLIITTILTIY